MLLEGCDGHYLEPLTADERHHLFEPSGRLVAHVLAAPESSAGWLTEVEICQPEV